MILSYLVGILPFIEQQAMWEQISSPSLTKTDGTQLAPSTPWPAMGPAPWQGQYKPWATEIATFRCPSDPGSGLPAQGRTNYAASIGDSIDMLSDSAFRYEGSPNNRWMTVGWAAERVRASQRGTFVFRQKMNFRDILDGTANTIAVGEIPTDLGDNDVRTAASTGHGSRWSGAFGGVFDNPEDGRPTLFDPLRPKFWCATGSTGCTPPTLVANDQRRGFRWADGRPNYTGMTTILPPNSELKLEQTGDGNGGVVSGGSRHQGGAHILMADGAVRFITDSIDAGNTRHPGIRTTATGLPGSTPGSQSPYGLWGSLGTRAAKETINAEF